MNNHNLKFVNDKIMVMTNFELSFLNAIKDIFPNFTFLKGCYFHYIKNLFINAKNIGLFRKIFIGITKLVIFTLKNYYFYKIRKY